MNFFVVADLVLIVRFGPKRTLDNVSVAVEEQSKDKEPDMKDVKQRFAEWGIEIGHAESLLPNKALSPNGLPPFMQANRPRIQLDVRQVWRAKALPAEYQNPVWRQGSVCSLDAAAPEDLMLPD